MPEPDACFGVLLPAIQAAVSNVVGCIYQGERHTRRSSREKRIFLELLEPFDGLPLDASLVSPVGSLHVLDIAATTSLLLKWIAIVFRGSPRKRDARWYSELESIGLCQ